MECIGMNKKITGIGILLILLLLPACSKKEPAVVKKESPPEITESDPELVEQVIKEESEEFIEFSLKDEKVLINLKMVPILDEYLQASRDKQRKIKQMELIELEKKENENIYILKFSCYEEQCSYILLDQDSDNTAFLLADLAELAEVKLSPDESRILFHFNRESTFSIPFSNLTVIDVEAWERLSPIPEIETKSMLQFEWPILSASWQGNDAVVAEFPNVTEPNEEQFFEWFEQDHLTKTITYQLESNS